MQVILQEKIRNLGNIGDVVEVKAGYARNYLFREGKALAATKGNVAVVEAKRAELEKIEKERIKEAKVRVVKLESLGEVLLEVHANPEGKLFGSVGAHEIAMWFAEKGQTVHKSEVIIQDGPLRFVGKYVLNIECYAGVLATLPLLVKSDAVIEEETEEVSVSAAESEQPAAEADVDTDGDAGQDDSGEATPAS